MTLTTFTRVAAATLCLLTLATQAFAQSETFPGINKYWKVDANHSTGGTLTNPDLAAAELKKRGFKAVINTAGGPAAAAERAALEKVGIKYLEFVINPETLDPAPVGPAIKAAADPANQPILIHSGNGHRAGALLLIKRAVVDGWTVEKAGVEAAGAGLINDNTMASRLYRFAYDYITAANRPK